MYYQPEAMLEQYDIEIKQITKGRGVFCCETDQGKKVLAPFRDLQNAQNLCAKYYAACRKRDIRWNRSV